MLVPELMDERNPAAIMNKNYDECCEICLVSDLPEHGDATHCGRCHEIFGSWELAEMHIHPRTGGCRWPGFLERFYDVRMYPDISIWYQKPDPKEKKD